MKRRALISVSDKTGIVEFAKKLAELGFEIVSTGGTSTLLSQNGVSVTGVSDVTGFPECLDGRVKTMHPNICAGILAMRSNPEHMDQLKTLDVTPIDVVVINLYPFKATISKPEVTLEDAIENIDIGGPTMLRSAAKNWQDVAVIVDPADYATVIDGLKQGEIPREKRFELATKVFSHTAAYDAIIANYFLQTTGEQFPEKLTLTYEKVSGLRYGENPHQSASYYREPLSDSGSITNATQLWGKELSYNNINDAAAALDVLKEFSDEKAVAVAIKHMIPCGVGVGETLFDAYMTAYNSDPVSIFGGIVALNSAVDVKTAEELSKIFLEIVIAPSFDDDALDVLKKKANIRLLELPDCAKPVSTENKTAHMISGGLLLQNADNIVLNENDIKVVTDRAPTDDEMKSLVLGMKVVKNVKSNAIVLVSENGTVGVGGGQTNRISALNIALGYAGDKAKGSVLASDAFFPFSDCVELAAKAGITAIIQPGGSIKDSESIEACNKAGIAMVFTGVRHFKH